MQRELWKLDDEAFRATRTAVVQDVSPVRLLVGTVKLKRQRLLWPHAGLSAFYARRSALADFRQTKVYVRFWRFLRDELFLDTYIRAGQYRLEYLWFMHGEPQYRLYCGEMLLGVVDAPKPALLSCQQAVAAYTMAAYGFRMSRVFSTRMKATMRKYTSDGEEHPALLTG